MEARDITSPIHRISVEQFHRMIDAGVFSDVDRVELIDGAMRDMSPIGPHHGSCADHLTMAFASALSGKAVVRVQGPAVLNEGTEVYPDLLALKLRQDRYATANPTADDVLLVIEVADSSLAADTTVKLAKYAGAGIRRYWVVDLGNRKLHDDRDPDRFRNRYRQPHTLDSGTITVRIADMDIAVDVETLFP
jgi:Uma2 family endonuclease